MTEFTGPWSPDRVAAFLQESTIPVRVGVHRPDESLWLVALWYRYREGSIECATWANAHIVRFLRNDSEVAFDVSTNDPPYRGVRGNGVASLAPDRGKAVLESLVVRYLGDTDSSLARWLLADEREEVRIRIDPREVHSWDYSDRMS